MHHVKSSQILQSMQYIGPEEGLREDRDVGEECADVQLST